MIEVQVTDVENAIASTNAINPEESVKQKTGFVSKVFRVENVGIMKNITRLRSNIWKTKEKKVTEIQNTSDLISNEDIRVKLNTFSEDKKDGIQEKNESLANDLQKTLNPETNNSVEANLPANSSMQSQNDVGQELNSEIINPVDPLPEISTSQSKFLNIRRFFRPSTKVLHNDECLDKKLPKISSLILLRGLFPYQLFTSTVSPSKTTPLTPQESLPSTEDPILIDGTEVHITTDVPVNIDQPAKIDESQLIANETTTGESQSPSNETAIEKKSWRDVMMNLTSLIYSRVIQTLPNRRRSSKIDLDIPPPQDDTMIANEPSETIPPLIEVNPPQIDEYQMFQKEYGDQLEMVTKGIQSMELKLQLKDDEHKQLMEKLHWYERDSNENNQMNQQLQYHIQCLQYQYQQWSYQSQQQMQQQHQKLQQDEQLHLQQAKDQQQRVHDEAMQSMRIEKDQAVNGLLNQIKQLESDKNQLNQMIVELQTDAKRLNDLLEMKRLEVEEGNGIIQTLEGTKQTLQNNVMRCEITLEEIMKEKNGLVLTVDELKKHQGVLEVDLQRRYQETLSNQTERQLMMQESQYHNELMNQMENKYQQMKGQFDQQTSELQSNQMVITQQKETIEELKRTNQKLMNDINALVVIPKKSPIDYDPIVKKVDPFDPFKTVSDGQSHTINMDKLFSVPLNHQNLF